MSHYHEHKSSRHQAGDLTSTNLRKKRPMTAKNDNKSQAKMELKRRLQGMKDEKLSDLRHAID